MFIHDEQTTDVTKSLFSSFKYLLWNKIDISKCHWAVGITSGQFWEINLTMQTNTILRQIQYSDKYNIKTNAIFRQMQYSDKYNI